MKWSGWIFMLLAGLLMFTYGCSHSRALTPQEKQKLSPALLKMLTNTGQDSGKTSASAVSEPVEVIVTTSNPEALKRAGFKIGSVAGRFATARMTVKELRKAVTMPSVQYISEGRKNYPN